MMSVPRRRRRRRCAPTRRRRFVARRRRWRWRRPVIKFVIGGAAYICRGNICCLANRQSGQAFRRSFQVVHFLCPKTQVNSLIKKITNKPQTISLGTSRAIPISANISGISIPSLTRCLRLVAIILQILPLLVIREGLKLFALKSLVKFIIAAPICAS